jgi:FtsZ-binding cell division protein ZapB
VKYIHANSNYIGFLSGYGGWIAQWDNSGNQTNQGFVQATQFLYLSDRRLKQNVMPIKDSLAKVTSLNGYSFDWKNTGKSDIGVIAQEVEKVFPTLVHEGTDTEGKKFKSVEYGNLVAPIIEAIKELASKLDTFEKSLDKQQSEIDILKTENAQLRSDNDSLKKRLDAIEAQLVK